MLGEKVKVMLTEGTSFFGPGTATLLQEIEACGSVREACRAMDMSYSKGRRILQYAENALGFCLVERQQGGKNGGEARLSERGADFLRRYRLFEEAVRQNAEQEFRKYFTMPEAELQDQEPQR